MIFDWKGGITNTPEETMKLGEQLTKSLEIGDVISLNGELAVGKTTFMKGVLSGFSYEGDVTSPTFTLINEYQSIPKIIHMDCYRENSLNRWISLGIYEYLESDTIVFIEWAELIQSLLPKKLIVIKFFHLGKNNREIILN